MTDRIRDEIAAAADAVETDVVAWRRDFHRHPELGFEEVRTSGIVARHLESLGLEVRAGIAGTGVLGILRAGGTGGTPVLLRADMDALPIQEVEGREYGSTVKGKMHACGHDGHTAMLLGAATILARHAGSLSRDVVFCFQPAEEGLGGAQRMIEAGILRDTGATEAYALHLWSPSPANTVHVRPGPTMAAADEFEAEVLGVGGHGALPHEARDPVLAAAHAVVAAQSVVSRRVDPIEPAVVTVGALHAGTAPNVIPDRARLEGTLRSFRESVRRSLAADVEAAMRGAVESVGCRLEFHLKPGFPAVVNDAAAAARARLVAGKVVGSERVHEPPPMAAAEDFSFFLNEIPGAFVFLGAGNPAAGIDAPHHSPAFDIDESVLPRGAELLARLALEKQE